MQLEIILIKTFIPSEKFKYKYKIIKNNLYISLEWTDHLKHKFMNENCFRFHLFVFHRKIMMNVNVVTDSNYYWNSLMHHMHHTNNKSENVKVEQIYHSCLIIYCDVIIFLWGSCSTNWIQHRMKNLSSIFCKIFVLYSK